MFNICNIKTEINQPEMSLLYENAGNNSQSNNLHKIAESLHEAEAQIDSP